MSVQEHAKKLRVDPAALRAFYRGLGPMPEPKERVDAPTFGFDGIEHLGNGWYMVGNRRVRGLQNALKALRGGEEE